MSYFFVETLPFVRPLVGIPSFERLSKLAARLVSLTPEIQLAEPALDLRERAAFRAEIDAIVADLYKLPPAEFGYILTTLPLLDRDQPPLPGDFYVRWNKKGQPKPEPQDPNHRYLSLTGALFDLGYIDTVVHPRLEDLKRQFFGSHADEPVILHRKELVNQRPPFESLRNPDVKEHFDRELLALLRELDYTVMTVVIDKLEHQQRYQVWRYDPYHYGLHVRSNESFSRRSSRPPRDSAILEGGKYDRSPSGRIEGWGQKWLP